MEGNPEHVVLIHGFAGSSATTWSEVGLDLLLTEAGRTVVPIDLLGHGAAPKPHDPAAYDDLEEQALAQFPDQPVDAIGFSMGARVLLVLASRHPERFRRIVVAGVGANLFGDRDDGTGGDIAAALQGGAAPEDVVAQVFARYAQADDSDPDALAAVLRRNAPSITPEDLARVTVPVLVVLGTEDFAGPAEPLLDALPDARHRPLPGVDHFATPKQFGFLDAALEFLDAVPV